MSLSFAFLRRTAPDLWIYALGHAYLDAEGNPFRFPGAAMDITERKRMEAELKFARDQAQDILEVSPMVFSRWIAASASITSIRLANKSLAPAARSCLGRVFGMLSGSARHAGKQNTSRPSANRSREVSNGFSRHGSVGLPSGSIPLTTAAFRFISAIFRNRERPKNRNGKIRKDPRERPAGKPGLDGGRHCSRFQ